MLPEVGAMGVGAVWGWLLGMLGQRPGSDWNKLLLGGVGSLLVGLLSGGIAGLGTVAWFIVGTFISLATYRLWRRYLKTRSA